MRKTIPHDARRPKTAYRLLSPEHFRGLAGVDTGGPSLVSVYLQLTPERGVGRAWHSAFSALVHTIPQTTDRAVRATAESDIQAIERALNEQLPELGRGVAFFACRERAIWHQIALRSGYRIHIARRPYLRPLLRNQGRSDRMRLPCSRASEPVLCQPSRYGRKGLPVKGQRIRGMLTDRVPRDRRDALAIRS
ncbi:hypothetical protein [Bradyrhizobium sp. BR 1432]|uniref:hypothetical protein n=1 Tax=Bradyrhizobium sp. BR 1432 TaxID=3447966 RepID=UPI003EE79D6D